MNLASLRKRIEGRVTTSTDDDYDELRRRMVWNQRTPARYPQLIVQVRTEQDVVETVRFAGAEGMTVSVRSGGHNWIGSPLRDESLLIDLGQLRDCSIDPQTRLATIQPAVTGQELNDRLDRYSLAFPIGHCPTVPLGGYLLNGGLGWNSNRWGPACFSIDAAKVVTAEGILLSVDDRHHADLLWAIRGSGAGFFGVVTRYRLKLYTAPRAIMTSTYFYPLEHVEEVGSWAGILAGQLPSDVELALFIVPAPSDLAGTSRPDTRFICMLSATAFLETEREAAAALGNLDHCPVSHQCLARAVNQPATFSSLLSRGHRFWPERHRYVADALWSDLSPSQSLAVTRAHFLRAPSPLSLALCSFTTGNTTDPSKFPDAAFSMSARTLLLSYAIWETDRQDEANVEWHRELVTDLEQFAVGRYAGESDFIAMPAYVERSFARTNWERLQSIRQVYDPAHRFHGFFNR